MRLIDADALIKKRNHAKAYAQDMYVIGQGYVMDAPTIDAVPVVRGAWTTLQQTCNGYGVMYYYHKECEVSGSEIHKRPFPYCPNCGAKMEDKPCGI
jgi:hypothetical protein